MPFVCPRWRRLRPASVFSVTFVLGLLSSPAMAQTASGATDQTEVRFNINGEFYF